MPLTPFRSTCRDSYVTTLEAFKAANPTLVQQVYRSRPSGITEQRAAFVGAIREIIPDLHSGVWQREIEVDVVVTQMLFDNSETTDSLEDTADALIDWLAADERAHLVADGTEQQPIRSGSIELDEGNGVIVPGVLITCRARIQQGRS